MKNFFFPMKIPQKQVWLLAASLSFGQMAFPIGNNVSGEASVASSIAVSYTHLDVYTRQISNMSLPGLTTVLVPS